MKDKMQSQSKKDKRGVKEKGFKFHEQLQARDSRSQETRMLGVMKTSMPGNRRKYLDKALEYGFQEKSVLHERTSRVSLRMLA